MLLIKEKINNYLNANKLSLTQFSKIIGYSQGAFSSMLNGRDSIPEHVIEKISPVLEVSVDEIKGWVIADKYPKEVLGLAVRAKKAKPAKGLILTAKIDEMLKSKNLSRTALSKLTGNSQSGLNRVIIGKETLSKKLMQKISLALDIPEAEIQSWVVADKYSLEALEGALREL